MEYAVIETGGKQYTVHPGETLRVEKLPVSPEETLEFDRVLLVSKDDEVTVGHPLVEGAKVITEVVAQGKAKKITVFKYKSKIRYRKKVGHRQLFTQLKVTEIVTGEKPGTRRRSTEDQGETPDGS